MSTTVSMWLGIAFVAIAILASVLQAWLWSFPMVPDPGGPDPNGKSTAPQHWTNTHRLLGLAYVVIYVALMAEMVPRLWEYQYELPARTVMHACMGIVIGVLLVTKIAVIRWLQHFGKALPSLGLGLLACTIVLATLSIPFALRAHDFGDALRPANLKRVERLLGGVEFDQPVVPKSLATEESFRTGVQVLTTKCTVCHDIRTILYKPRSAKSWHSLVQRMALKPTIGERLTESEIPAVVAYLVAITPDIQESFKLKRAAQRSRRETAKNVVAAARPAPAAATSKPDGAAGEKLLEEKCTDCHEVDDIDEHGKDDVAGWTAIVASMLEEQGAELTEDEARSIIAHLAASRGK